MLFSKDEDKKKKLKENMSKIRDMIEGKNVEEPDLDPKDIEKIGTSQKNSQSGPDRRQGPGKTEGDLPEIPEPPSKPKSEGRRNRKPRDRSSRRRRSSSESLDLDSHEIPEPAKTREINVPDIEKGPLFIKKEKFFEASDRVQGMKQLSQELESNLEQLRETLYEDEDISSELSAVLEDINGNVSNMKDIVSP